MDVPAPCMRDPVKLSTESGIGGVAGKKNLFLYFRYGFQDVQVNALCPAHRIPVKEKEQA